MTSSNLRNLRNSIQFQIPQIVGLCCSNNLRSEECSVFISISDSSHCRIWYTKKTYRVRNFFDFLQSEESSKFKSVSDSSGCRISNMIKATKWGILKNERLASKFFSSRKKLFPVLVVLIFCQSDTLIPQIVGFHFTKILQSGEFSLITFNLRKTLFSIEITIPQIAGFNWTKNHANWGICSNNLHSEEYSVFILSWDSWDCRIKMCGKTYRVGNFFLFIQSEEYSDFTSVSDSSDCRISSMTNPSKWGILKN